VIWVLDTNIFILALNGRPSVRDGLNHTAAAGEVVTSVFVLGEFLHGAQCSKRSTENLRTVEKEVFRIRILPVTEAISRRFADLKTMLRREFEVRPFRGAISASPFRRVRVLHLDKFCLAEEVLGR
jgi:predicted nucleic acid-binding protein